jgi:hypothetical protein
MPKSKTRKKGIAQGKRTTSVRRTSIPSPVAEVALDTTSRPTPAVLDSGMRNMQGVMMSAMGAIGCWGLACYYVFLMHDPNHYLFGGMAALLAIIWSFMFGLRFRKRQIRR